MSIQDWGAIGEIVGGIAVVASLIYLAVQIRQNTEQISQSIEANRLAAFERNIDAGNRIRELIILNPELAELFTRGLENYDELQDTDKLRFGMLMRNMFSEMQGAYVRQLSVGSDPDAFAGSARILDSLLEHGGVRAWLDKGDPDWRPEFTAFVRERLAQFRQAK